MPARSSAARAAAVPRSAAESAASAPPNFPIGVRTGAARTILGRRTESVTPRAIAVSLSSARREGGLTLLDVGRETLLRVVALEELLLELAFERQRRLERDLGARLDRALDPA